MVIKLFATDVDGTMTDAGMYYTEDGNEFKKFNTHDGMGFKILRDLGIKTAIITSEDTPIVKKRAEKIKADFLSMGNFYKLEYAKKLCKELNISLNEVAYIGDDINDIDLLKAAGVKACPNNAVKKVKEIQGIILLKSNGGEGAVREFIEIITADKNQL